LELFCDGICASLLFSLFLPSLWMNPSAVGTSQDDRQAWSWMWRGLDYQGWWPFP
jgi:hypothetical protein